MPPLRFVSLLADNAAALYAEIAAYIGRRTRLGASFEEAGAWQERERLLDRGQVDAGFVCGLPYTRKVDRGEAALAPIAAPVLAAPRYRGRPIYYSDVVVRRDSPAERFADLRGARWAYNERRSHSGYNLVRFHLAELGETEGYFASAVEAGAHQAAIEIVLAGAADAAAIDSYVLELELAARPALSAELRVIDSLGPSPSPPLVAAGHVPDRVRRQVAAAVTTMHEDPQGAAVLARARIRRFVPVVDADYDPVRRMSALAAAARL